MLCEGNYYVVQNLLRTAVFAWGKGHYTVYGFTIYSSHTTHNVIHKNRSRRGGISRHKAIPPESCCRGYNNMYFI